MNANPAYEGYDAQRVWRDFPILSRQIHGRPLTFLDSAASSTAAMTLAGRCDEAALSTTTKNSITPTCIVACTC